MRPADIETAVAAAPPHVEVDAARKAGGARPNAAGLAARLLENYEHDLAAVEIVPGDNGIFDVHVDGRLVFTKSMIGRYPDPDDVLPLVQAQLGS